MSVKSAFLAEDVSTMWTNNTINIVFFAHVRGKIRNLLVALGTGQVLEASNVNLEPVNVESCFSCKLLITIWTLSNIGLTVEDWLGLYWTLFWCLLGRTGVDGETGGGKW